MVGGDVSVGFGLIRRGGMRRVGDRGDAVCQGSCNKALNPRARSWETPCCCNIDQTWGKSETQMKKKLR